MFQTVIPTYFISIQIKESINRDHTGRPNLIHDFHFVMILGANRNIRFTWRNFGCIFKLNVSEGT